MKSLLAHARDQRGQALIEFTLCFSLLIFLLMGALDFGRAVFYNSLLASAAREGARYGILEPRNANGIMSQARAALYGLNPNDVTITLACVPDCVPGDSITVTTSYTFRPITAFFRNIDLHSVSTMTIE